MAGYRGHLAGATLFVLGYIALLAYAFSVDAAYEQFSVLEQIGYPLGLVVLALLFGLWPDVDTNSKGQRVFYSIFLVTDLFLIATEQFRAAAYLGLVALLPVLSHHRGWTHTWWAMLLIPSPLLLLPSSLLRSGRGGVPEPPRRGPGHVAPPRASASRCRRVRAHRIPTCRLSN
jgi:chromate transport protein ChrA